MPRAWDKLFIKTDKVWGTWVAQLAEHPTVGFGSGHDPRAVGWSPASGSTLSVEHSKNSLSLCPSPLLTCSISL